VLTINDPKIQIDWKYLQTSDHFYYMNTKFFIQGSLHSYFNPYNSPYDAFINYMNVLSDFEIRVNEIIKAEAEPSIEQHDIDELMVPSKPVAVARKKATKATAVAKKATTSKKSAEPVKAVKEPLKTSKTAPVKKSKTVVAKASNPKNVKETSIKNSKTEKSKKKSTK
jgi:alpha-amylase/alpha-mannosidase (GH57 family)